MTSVKNGDLGIVGGGLGEKWSGRDGVRRRRERKKRKKKTRATMSKMQKRKLKLTGGPFLCSWNYDVLFHARGHLRGFFP